MQMGRQQQYATNKLPNLQRIQDAKYLPPNEYQFDVRWATSEEEVREAQALRYRVFATEMGASLTPSCVASGLDIDRFDPFCDHLLVRAIGLSRSELGPLVGTYRVLSPSAARHAGGFYTDTEFDLKPIASLRSNAIELGRSCVDPTWRSGAVIMALWSALARYMLLHEVDTMIGCASVGLDRGMQHAADVWHRLRHAYLVAPQWQIRPRIPLPLCENVLSPHLSNSNAFAETPPLIKGYLRCGARLLGAPALDAAFNTADLPIMLRVDDLAPRYRKHFLGD